MLTSKPVEWKEFPMCVEDPFEDPPRNLCVRVTLKYALQVISEMRNAFRSLNGPKAQELIVMWGK